MIDADAPVLLPGAGLIIPEGVFLHPAVTRHEGVRVAKVLQLAETLPRGRIGERVFGPCTRVPAILVAWDAVIVASQHDGLFRFQKGGGAFDQPVHPAQLVFVLVAGTRIAVWQIDGRDAHRARRLYQHFEVTALFVFGLAGKVAHFIGDAELR